MNNTIQTFSWEVLHKIVTTWNFVHKSKSLCDNNSPSITLSRSYKVRHQSIFSLFEGVGGGGLRVTWFGQEFLFPNL